MTRPQVANIFFILIAFTAFLAPVSANFVASPEAFKYSFLSLVILLALSLWMFRPDVEGGFALNKSWLSLALLALIGWAYLSGFWAVDAALTLGRASEWLFCFLAYFLALHFILNDESLQKLFTFLFFAAIVVAFIGILQHLFDFGLFLQAAPPAATFGNRNMAIHFMVLSFSLGSWLFLKEKKTALEYTYAIGIAFIIAFAIITRTRAGWLAIGLQTLFIVIFLFVLRPRTRLDSQQ